MHITFDSSTRTVVFELERTEYARHDFCVSFEMLQRAADDETVAAYLMKTVGADALDLAVTAVTRYRDA